MKADDCSVRCNAIGQFALSADIPQLPRSRRHDMLFATYLRACGGSTDEDLCQILIQDIQEASRLESPCLAADLLVVLGIVVGECGRAPANEIASFHIPRAAGTTGGEKAA